MTVIVVEEISSTTIDFAGREYFVANGDVHGNVWVSPVEIGRAVYRPAWSYVKEHWLFKDGEIVVGSGAMSVSAAHHASWSLPITGDAVPRTVSIFISIHHVHEEPSSYRIIAGGVHQTLTKSTSGLSSYRIGISFRGSVEVIMESLSSSATGAKFWLAGAVDDSVVPAATYTPIATHMIRRNDPIPSLELTQIVIPAANYQGTPIAASNLTPRQSAEPLQDLESFWEWLLTQPWLLIPIALCLGLGFVLMLVLPKGGLAGREPRMWKVYQGGAKSKKSRR
jgi:hypothetical protein